MGTCYGSQMPVGAGYSYGSGPGSYAYGAGPLIDADPITPGIQTTPGVVTPVGPPRVAGLAGGVVPPYGGSIGPIGATTYQTTAPGFGAISPSSGIGIGVPPYPVGATSFGYGTSGPIVAPPLGGAIGVPPIGVPPIGGPIGGPIVGPVGGFAGTTTTFGGPVGTGFGPGVGVGVNPGYGLGPGVAGGYGGSYLPGGMGIGGFPRVDVDPISPGVQNRPGVITATGPTTMRFWFKP